MGSKLKRIKWGPQQEWCLGEAERRLRIARMFSRVKIAGKVATVVVRGQPCVEVDDGNGGTHPVRGYVVTWQPPRINVALAARDDIGVDDVIYVWEFGRLLLHHAGVVDIVEQERRLNAARVRSIRGRHA